MNTPRPPVRKESFDTLTGSVIYLNVALIDEDSTWTMSSDERDPSDSSPRPRQVPVHAHSMPLGQPTSRREEAEERFLRMVQHRAKTNSRRRLTQLTEQNVRAKSERVFVDWEGKCQHEAQTRSFLPTKEDPAKNKNKPPSSLLLKAKSMRLMPTVGVFDGDTTKETSYKTTKTSDATLKRGKGLYRRPHLARTSDRKLGNHLLRIMGGSKRCLKVQELEKKEISNEPRNTTTTRTTATRTPTSRRVVDRRARLADMDVPEVNDKRGRYDKLPGRPRRTSTDDDKSAIEAGPNAVASKRNLLRGMSSSRFLPG